MKTLEEVRQHFEGVEIAKCVASKKEFNFADADRRGIHYDHDAYWIVTPNCSSYMIYSPNIYEFAEIVKEENVFQFYSKVLDEWLDLSPDRKYRIKPDYQKEIAELERQIEELRSR